MTPERWAQIRQIFEASLERADKDRAAYLRVVCAGDDALRKEVEGLLGSHQSNPEFMATPAADLGRALMSSGTIEALAYGSGAFSSGGYQDPDDYQAGLRVGPYQLQQRIGRGGMGSVWLANRFDHEFHRKVAVKLVNRGMDTQEILRRFRLERQLLAGLEHQNIAHLLDGGSTAEGLPFIVMEYVEGVRIDEYCESHQLAISGRLSLFRQVCAAVQYAHSNLVVHRDIKASNILVTPDGIPKLLDFGIAKLLRTEFSTLVAAETRPELRPMTLDYASPEQVRGEQITTSTDVYSLGVLLYKLLTGRFPYGLDQRNQASIQHAICNTEPIRPSAVILVDTNLAIPQPTQKIEIGRETRPKARARLRKKLSGDLDMVILKALRKEPAMRYASVEQFSEDLRRYLEGRPVIARSDTFTYRTGKFLRRNLFTVIAASILIAALLAGAVTSVRYAQEAGRQRGLAETQFSTAQDAAIRQQTELMNAYFKLGGMQSTLEDRVAARQTYYAALEAARRFATLYPGNTIGYLSVARAAVRVGDTAPDESADRYREALTQFDALTARSYAFRPEEFREQIAVTRRLGLAQFAKMDYPAALATFSRGLQIAETLNDRPLMAAGNFYSAEVLSHNNAPEAAVTRFRKAFELWRELAGSSMPVKDPSPGGYEKSLADLASQAPTPLRRSIESDLATFNIPTK